MNGTRWRRARQVGANLALQGKADHPRGDERQPPGETAMDDNAAQQHNARQNPVPNAGDILGEMIRRREADLRKQHQRQGHAEIRRIENVLRAASADGSADENFRADGKRDGKNNRPQPFVG